MNELLTITVDFVGHFVLMIMMNELLVLVILKQIFMHPINRKKEKNAKNRQNNIKILQL